MVHPRDVPAEQAWQLERGTTIDHFQVLRPLGQGGMAEVYLARDRKLGRKVALKLLKPNALDEEGQQKFLFEARATAKFSHPHIVSVFAMGEFRGRAYIALEYLTGESLRQRLERSPLSAVEAMRVGLALAEALAEAHRHSILHRDLKPENVMMASDGRPRVVDFGLAKKVNALPREFLQEPPSDATETVDISQELEELQSDPGYLRGTSSYVSPEQWRSERVDGATDIWGLGVILYELLAGRRPFAGKSYLDLAIEVCSAYPSPKLGVRAGVPAALAGLVDRCLTKPPEVRPSAEEVAAELRSLITGVELSKQHGDRPFRGLLPFGEEQRHLFFGREDEVGAFMERLRLEPLLPVIGPSGAGKSSFVQAGVIPRLRERGPLVVVQLRPGRDPFAALATQIVAAERRFERSRRRLADSGAPAAEPSAPSALSISQPLLPGTLVERLRAAPATLSLELHALAERCDAQVLLFVDQLEELYTQVGDDAERQAFMAALCTAADDPDLPMRVVFTLREEFLSRVAAGPGVREALTNIVVLRPPSVEALRHILRAPVELFGCRFDDPDLVDDMVAEVAGEVACLPLLQFAALQLWVGRDREARLLKRATYDAMGGVAGALAQKADEVLAGLTDDERELARQLLLRLITGEATRRAMPRAQLIEGLAGEAEEVLNKLVGARLVVASRSEEGEEGDLDLAHESLISSWATLARWIDESREELVFLEETGQAAALWQRRGFRNAELLKGDALRDAQRARERCQAAVPPMVDDFIGESERRAEVTRRRRRLAIGTGVVGLLAVAISSLIAAITLSQREQVAQRHSRALRGQWAVAQQEGARAAYTRGDLLEARARVRSALEAGDSATARFLWWQLSQDPLQWRHNVASAILGVAYSPDGATIAAGLQDRTVRLVDAVTKAERVLRGHQDQVFAVAFSPDNRQLASADHAGEIRLWELASGRTRIFGRHGDAVWDLAFSPDGTRLLSAGKDGQVQLWDATGGRVVRAVRLPGEVLGASFSPDGRWIATATSEKRRQVRIWSADLEGTHRYLEGSVASVAAVAFSPDSELAAAAGYDSTVRVWRTLDGESVAILRGHEEPVSSVSFTPSGRRIISAGADRSLVVWDASTWQRLHSLEGHASAIAGGALSPDGLLVAAGGGDAELRLWRTDLRQQLESAMPGHEEGVCAVAFSPDGSLIASGSYDRTARLWDTLTGEQLTVLRGHKGDVNSLSFTPDGKLLATASSDSTVRLWDVSTGREEAVLSGHDSPIYSVDVTADGRLLISGSYDKMVWSWSVQERKKLFRLEIGSFVRAVCSSPDSSTLAVGSRPGEIQLWDLLGRRRMSTLSGHTDEVLGLSFSPDGQRLVSSGADGRVLLRELASGRSQQIASHQDWVYGVSFSPDGMSVASASGDGSARITSLTGGEPITMVEGEVEVNACDFSPDGHLIAIGADDGVVRLWDRRSSMPIWRGPLLLARPPLRFSHRGWARLGAGEEGATPSNKSWMRTVEQNGLEAVASTSGEILCLRTAADQVELWELARDQRLANEQVHGLHDLVATERGCAALGGAEVLLLAAGGALVRLPMAVRAALFENGDLLLATDDQLLRYPRGGTVEPIRSIDPGVTAVLRIGQLLVLGFVEGSIALHSFTGRDDPPDLSFEQRPSSPVRRLLAGPGSTLVVGFDSGLVGLWSLDSGALLHRVRLHGPVSHLLLERDTLHAQSVLGDYAVVDLSALTQDHCDLLGSLWSQVPVVWERGQPRRVEPRPPPGCAGP